MHKIFVFGTLKEGFPNFKTNKGVRYRGDFETKQGYPLYLVGERFSPWLILQAGKGSPVKGQVFDVSDDILAQMDTLERITATDGYRKVSISVVCLESGDEINVLVYGKPPEMLNGAKVMQELAGEYLLEHAALYRSRMSD
ncbi:gamma-glutamylcyclotransferase [Marinomonas rhizomae]|uniref:gamma-glutamylcyclotransferase family protein n=1 Tax=Marinomonas rhizomae TaxID=491948 RepID=UPI00210344B1|nr:gamma-glutamylcyclotransferase family protein [Marinomonas rhizomae]UTW00978.1 gamma-glutamylcyclotransferase [Marinomonas rhizomae]